MTQKSLTNNGVPIPILMYHQIDIPPQRGTPMRGMVVSPASFARQMIMLRCLGYQGLSMVDLLPYLNGERQGKVVGITFDDGYQSVVNNALPILKKHSFTATNYGVSNLMAGQNSWDETKGVPQVPLLGIDGWRAWIDSGMDVGAHSCHHVDLTKVDIDEARKEITDSRIYLETALNTPVQHFCYPYGQYSEEHIPIVNAAGYATATTVKRGRVWAGKSLWELPRVLVAQSTNLGHFFLKLATQYEDKRGVPA